MLTRCLQRRGDGRYAMMMRDTRRPALRRWRRIECYRSAVTRRRRSPPRPNQCARHRRRDAGPLRLRRRRAGQPRSAGAGALSASRALSAGGRRQRGAQPRRARRGGRLRLGGRRRPGRLGPDRPRRRAARRGAVAAGARQPGHDAEDPFRRAGPADAARRPRGNGADPPQAGRAPAPHRARRDGGDLDHRPVRLPQGRARRRHAGQAHRGRAAGGPARHRGSSRHRIRALRGRGRHHAEPSRPRARHRDGRSTATRLSRPRPSGSGANIGSARSSSRAPRTA